MLASVWAPHDVHYRSLPGSKTHTHRKLNVIQSLRKGCIRLAVPAGGNLE
jgi:hypothetical protein